MNGAVRSFASALSSRMMVVSCCCSEAYACSVVDKSCEILCHFVTSTRNVLTKVKETQSDSRAQRAASGKLHNSHGRFGQFFTWYGVRLVG